jgi:hypothetical protein
MTASPSIRKQDRFPILGDAMVTLRRWAVSLKDLKIDDQYLGREIPTNKTWVDGKRVYRKVVDLGSLPNSSNIQIPHLVKIDTIVSLQGMATSGVFYLPLPYPHETAASAIRIYADDTVIAVYTTSNRSEYVGFAILEYTRP